MAATSSATEPEKANKVAVPADSAELDSLVTSFTKRYTALVHLALKLGEAGKSAFLSFKTSEDPDNADPSKRVQYMEYKRRHLNSALTELNKDLSRTIKAIFNRSKKPVSTREKAEPGSFGGVYGPIVVGPVLTGFFGDAESAARFGYVDPSNDRSGLLMDQLPLARAGYMLRNTLNMLFHTYNYAQGLESADSGRDVSADDNMRKYFGDARAYPALWYTQKAQTGTTIKELKDAVTKKKVATRVPKWESVKYPMEDAVARGLIERPLSTFEAVQATMRSMTDDYGRQKDFDPANFPTANFQSLGSANYISKGAFDDAQKEYVESVLQQLLDEHNIVRDTNAIWKQLRLPASEERKERKQKQKSEADKARRAAARAAKA